MAIRFFGKMDRSNDGKNRITSAIPVWMQEQNTEELRQEIGDIEGRIEAGNIEESAMKFEKMRLRQKKDMLAQIEKERPKFTAAEKDATAKFNKRLGEEIKDLMPTRSQLETGRGITPHDYLNRTHLKHTISIGNEIEAEIVKQCGINPERIKDGKLTGKDAEYVWKITSGALGKETNTDRIRRPGMTDPNIRSRKLEYDF